MHHSHGDGAAEERSAGTVSPPSTSADQFAGFSHQYVRNGGRWRDSTCADNGSNVLPRGGFPLFHHTAEVIQPGLGARGRREPASIRQRGHRFRERAGLCDDGSLLRLPSRRLCLVYPHPGRYAHPPNRRPPPFQFRLRAAPRVCSRFVNTRRPTDE